ncbi:hypothetical protein GSI_08519 [Ganoderma sinense ZZ0214-1]|uniref:Uncharacterized protein n=1 Tax=Ganoderma sinense ZZ0214-1 TaxID=1077348 RepID=A0A2G8S3Z2_9APHY|nr:hypothetical protein GSI_08519 [Ganoderma sinense ZZ0214-1]
MPVMHNTVRTLCAAYFAVSLIVSGIILHAMWDSFVNGMVRLEVLSESGADFKASQSTLSVLSTSTSSHKAIVCSAVSEDETFAVLVASLGVFTAALQEGNSLWLCNHEGAVCFTFICDEDLNRFVTS